MTPEQQAILDRYPDPAAGGLTPEQQAILDRYADPADAPAPGSDPRAMDPRTGMPEGMVYNPQTGQVEDLRSPINQRFADDGSGTTAASGALRGLTLSGGDEIVGGLYGAGRALAGQGGFNENREFGTEVMRETERRAQERDPGKFLAAELGGGVVSALVPGAAVARGGSLGARSASGAGAGATMGALQAYLDETGGVDERMGAVPMGAAVGGSVGLAIPGVAAFGKQVVRGAQGAARNAAVGGAIGRDLGVSPQAGRVVSRLVGEENQPAMREALRRAGPDAMLADASPNTSGMLDAAMRNPAPGAAIARQRVDERAGTAYNNVVDALTGGRQGPRMPPVAAQRTMGQAARGRINPLYQRAYDTPIDYASDQGRAIEEILTRIPASKARAAIDSATERMVYDGFPKQQIMAEIGEDGSVKFRTMPNVMQLDYIKRAFDDIAADGKDAVTGRMSSEGAFASRIARDIREATKDAVPAYGEALAAASTDIRTRGAVQAGQRLLRPQTTVEEVTESIGDATPAELRAMREGVLGQVEHIMGNVRAVASDQDIDARQAMSLYKELSSPNAQRKLQALFGDDWPAISEQMDQAGAALGLRARVAGNSATQPRQAAAQMVADEVTPGAVRSLQPLGSVQEIGRRALGSDAASVSRLSTEVQAELAELLTRQGGGGVEALNAVVQALARNPIQPRAGQGLQNALTASGFAGLPAASDRLRSLLGQ